MDDFDKAREKHDRLESQYFWHLQKTVDGISFRELLDNPYLEYKGTFIKADYFCLEDKMFHGKYDASVPSWGPNPLPISAHPYQTFAVEPE